MSRYHQPPSSSDDEEEYTVVPAIPVDYAEHTDDHPFCADPTCPCHEDQALIGEVAEAIQDGLATSEDANRIYQGKTV